MITDTFLVNMAKLLNDEAVTNPSYEGYSSDVIVPDATHTSSDFTGEISVRTTATGSRTNNSVTFTSLKTGATLGSSTDTINTIALFNSSTAGELFTEAIVPSLIQTSDFDVETDWQLTFERKA